LANWIAYIELDVHHEKIVVAMAGGGFGNTADREHGGGVEPVC
jgi:hypothetical protein